MNSGEEHKVHEFGGDSSAKMQWLKIQMRM